jgi:hypothetical protein
MNTFDWRGLLELIRYTILIILNSTIIIILFAGFIKTFMSRMKKLKPPVKKKNDPRYLETYSAQF